MIGHATVAIGSTASFHSSGGATEDLEYSRLPILVHDAVALEDNTTLVLASRGALGELSILEHADPEDVAEVNSLLFSARFGRHVVPFLHRVDVPDLLLE